MMRYFRNESGFIISYSEEEVEAGYGAGLDEMTQGEIDLHLNPPSTYQQELAGLNRAYQSDTESYKQAYSLAFLADGPQEQAKQAAIRDLYTARKALHAADLASLKARYSGSAQ